MKLILIIPFLQKNSHYFSKEGNKSKSTAEKKFKI